MKRRAFELDILWGAEASRMFNKIIDEGTKSRVHHRYIQASMSAPVLAKRPVFGTMDTKPLLVRFPRHYYHRAYSPAPATIVARACRDP